MSYLNRFIQQCHDNLLNNSSHEIIDAKDYLLKRNIQEQSILLHKIGYCNQEETIPRQIAFYGKKEEDFDADNEGYSYFIQGRIIVPIYSEFGFVVGFATRKPSFEQGNTWWNLSKPFSKSSHLFLLDKSRKEIFDNDKIYIVEGYIDAIILYQQGLKNIVSIMGTNLSYRQIGLIARYCSNVCFCLDVDENNSGQKGQNKSIHSIKTFDFVDSISVIDALPIGEDPDVFVTKNGIDAFKSKEKKLTSLEIKQICKKIQNEIYH